MKTMMRARTTSFATAMLLLSAGAIAASEFRRGVWIANDATALPLPTSGYQVYLIGEMHGVQENVTTFEAYLKRLVDSGIRDVAVEEDSVYERAAEAYVTNKADTLPAPLCLRAGVLDVVKRFNASRSVDQLIRIHLVDVDTPASAIRQHLAILKDLIAAARSVAIPDVDDIKERGLKAVEDLKRVVPADPRLLAELRTIEYSIQAYRDGLEIGDRPPFKGSPYLEAREEAIASNLKDVLRTRGCKGVLVQYGSDHVSKVRRKDGGPNRDSLFEPMALRLESGGVKVFSLLTVPLSGTRQWRGQKEEMLWRPSDASLSTGESLDQVLSAAQRPAFLYVDPRLEKIQLPSQDLNGFRVDAYLLFASGTALADRCTVRKP